MTQNRGFNNDFTDEDAARLCQYAALANHPQHRYYTCGWVTGQGICSAFIQGHDFPDHLRSCHGVAGPDKVQLMCCWVGCSVEMKKESLMRHVNERHLEVKFACPNCPELFTRDYTMRNHISKKHSGS